MSTSLPQLEAELSSTKAELSRKICTIEELEKEVREVNHLSKQKISELEMKLESAEKKISSLQELTTSLRESTLSDNSSKSMITELENKILDFENVKQQLEQNEMNLQRQIHNKNVELSELRLEIDKLTLNLGTSKTETEKAEQKMGLENLDEETNNLLNSLIQEIDDLKKEKTDFQEKALERITEKEMENIELKEILEQTKSEFQKEINELLMKAGEKQIRFDDDGDGDESNQSQDSINNLELQDKVYELERTLKDVRAEMEQKIEELEEEKAKNLRELENVENDYKNRLQSAENEVVCLKMEYSKIEMEKLSIQRELTSDNETKNSFFKTIEEYQVKIKNLEDLNQKAEGRYKSQLSSLNTTLEETEQSVKYYKFNYDKTKEELMKLKETSSKSQITSETSFKKEIDAKEKQIKMLNDKLDQATKEFEKIKAENERFTKNNEKNKNNYLEIQETLKSLKENHYSEVKKWEDKYYDLEKKFESEKNSLIENNTKLHKEITQQKTFGNKTTTHTLDNNKEFGEERMNTLDDVLNEDGGEFDLEDGDDSNSVPNLRMKIVSLESQITVLNNTISDLKINIENLKKQKELSDKANTQLKDDLKETKNIYEKQIQEMQKNTTKINSERTSLRRSINLGEGVGDLNPRQLQVLTELNKTISNLKAENKFLADTNELLIKEKTNINDLRISDVTYYKEELRKAEQLAVNAKIQFATYVFEKEEEVIKLKQLNKKFMDKLGLTFN